MVQEWIEMILHEVNFMLKFKKYNYFTNHVNLKVVIVFSNNQFFLIIWMKVIKISYVPIFFFSIFHHRCSYHIALIWCNIQFCFLLYCSHCRFKLCLIGIVMGFSAEHSIYQYARGIERIIRSVHGALLLQVDIKN